MSNPNLSAPEFKAQLGHTTNLCSPHFRPYVRTVGLAEMNRRATLMAMFAIHQESMRRNAEAHADFLLQQEAARG